MNDRATVPLDQSSNQPPLLAGYNAWEQDAILRAAVEREGGAWIDERAQRLGEMVGSERMQLLADQANRHLPQLRTHDRFGERIDAVDYHPAYYELMALAFGAGLHSVAWKARRDGAFVARAALNYLWNQAENGTSCPVTMAFAAVQVMRNDAQLAAEWEPKLLADAYDPSPLHLSQKSAVTVGMAMTEKQGGSDLRANQTVATELNDGAYALEGHKWFCSAPMSDGFLTLARTGAGVTCFFVPRSLADGSRNGIRIQRLKDKCGNRSNASSEIEYHGAWARRIGAEGRGIATLIEMAHLTRFDIVVASAGMMRGALNQALHHCEHRRAFGRRLVEQPLMQNVLADLALETEAATLLALRLARALDRSAHDPQERLLARILTPVAKYWLAKRNPAFMFEAMECLGGNGYVEEAPMARFYREAPVNSIWEGSGNVACLDVLRSMQKQPDSVAALLAEIHAGAAGDRHLAIFVKSIEKQLAEKDGIEQRARRIVEMAALALQASLMAQHAAPAAADAFFSSRVQGDWGHAFGTLPGGTRCDEIIARSRLGGGGHPSRTGAPGSLRLSGHGAGSAELGTDVGCGGV
ncbi:MAG: DNA alkylation response protein [Betaproteobacteria bacterium]|nr:MAG: DNA alkylation response protein [Betaproteobacteria bacterium]